MPKIHVDSRYQAQVDELQAFIKKERDARQVKKALAVKLTYQGYKHEVIVRVLEVAMGSITKWRQQYEAEGLDGFRPKPRGRKQHRSEDERE